MAKTGAGDAKARRFPPGSAASLIFGSLGALLGYLTLQRPFAPGTSVAELLIPAGALLAGVVGIVVGARARRRASRAGARSTGATIGVVLGVLVAAFAGWALLMILSLCGVSGGRLTC